jgi:hypothetical protein
MLAFCLGRCLGWVIAPGKRVTASSRVGGILLTGSVVSFCGAAGLQGRVEEKVELARGLRHETSLK